MALGIVGALVLSAGFGLAVIGLIGLLVGPSIADAPPTCDGKAMSPGDRCWSEVGGQVTVTTYEDAQRRRESGQGLHDVLIGSGACLGGGAVLLLGGWWTVRRARRHL